MSLVHLPDYALLSTHASLIFHYLHCLWNRSERQSAVLIQVPQVMESILEKNLLNNFDGQHLMEFHDSGNYYDRFEVKHYLNVPRSASTSVSSRCLTESYASRNPPCTCTIFSKQINSWGGGKIQCGVGL